jgi:hypothetical protein
VEIGQCITINTIPTSISSNLTITAVSNNTAAITVNASSYNVSGSTNTFEFLACAVNSTTPQTVAIIFGSTGSDTANFIGQGTFSIVPHEITFNTASNITIPRGGCSSAYTITVSSVPVTDVSVLLTNLTNEQFYIQGINGSSIQFNSVQSMFKTVFFCIYGNTTTQIGTYSFTPSITGTNLNQFQINNGASSPINFTLVVPTSVTITNSAVTYTAGTTNGTITVTTSLDGTLYYYIRDPFDISTPVDNVSLATLQAAVANNISNFIHSQADYLTYLYATPRFLFVGSANTTATVPQTLLPIVTYMPNTTYEFC